MKAGVAISPDTPSTAITNEVGAAADMLLVMTVYPGRGGQKFIESCVPKVAELRERFPEKDIEVDGGVGPATVGMCADAGVYLAYRFAFACVADIFALSRQQRYCRRNRHFRCHGCSWCHRRPQDHRQHSASKDRTTTSKIKHVRLDIP